MFELRIDDAKFRPYLKAVLEEVLRENGIIPKSQPLPTMESAAQPANFFASSQKTADLLHQLQAPDPDAGQRREPHWRLKDIHIGDRVFFRDAPSREIVGYGIAENIRRGPHPWNDACPAVIVEIGQGVRFEHAIPDDMFRVLFRKHGGNRPDFPLFDGHGRFARKTYVYPLRPSLAEELMTLGGRPSPAS